MQPIQTHTATLRCPVGSPLPRHQHVAAVPGASRFLLQQSDYDTLIGVLFSCRWADQCRADSGGWAASRETAVRRMGDEALSLSSKKPGSEDFRPGKDGVKSR